MSGQFAGRVSCQPGCTDTCQQIALAQSDSRLFDELFCACCIMLRGTAKAIKSTFFITSAGGLQDNILFYALPTVEPSPLPHFPVFDQPG